MQDRMPAGSAGRRHALRDAVPATLPWWAPVSLIGLFAVMGLAMCVWQLGRVEPSDVGWMAGFAVLVNLGEWAAHRWPLHRPMVPRAVHHRHVAEHHAFFTAERMAVDGWDDLRWVVFPPWALPLLVASVAPVAVVVMLLAGPRPAWLLVLVVIAYYGLYEILHALAHWPRDTRLAGYRTVRALTEHHRVHHDPALMRRWNFNFAIPLFDRAFGTQWRPPA